MQNGGREGETNSGGNGEAWYRTDPMRLAKEWAEAGYNASRLASRYGLNRSTFHTWIKRHQLEPGVVGMPTGTLPFDPSESMRELRVPVNAGIAVTSDWHLPVTSYSVVRDIVALCKRHGIRQLAVCGDWFNMDAFGDYMPKQGDANLPRELLDSRELMRWLLEQFDVIYLTLGNHDWRAVKQLGYRLKFEHTMRIMFAGIADDLLDRLVVTNRDYLIVDTPVGPWRCAHTNSYSRQPLARPCKYADRHRMHMALGHAHHHAIGTSPSGYYAVELGGVFDGSRTEYLQRWTNDFPEWRNGWMLLPSSGIPYLPLLAPLP